MQRTRERETPAKQRRGRQPSWPPLPAWRLSPPAFSVLPEPAPLEAGAPHAPGGQSQAARNCGFRSGLWELSQLGLGDRASTGHWPSPALTSHAATSCGHLSLGKPEAGVTAPSGRSYPMWGLLFRDPAVGQCPTWRPASVNLLSPARSPPLETGGQR